MTPGLTPAATGLHPAIAVAFAIAAVAGALAAVSGRDGRVAVLGLLVALLASPFLADPLPDLRGVAARIAGAVLAAYPLRIAIRTDPGAARGSSGGWPADLLIAVTAAIAAAGAAGGWWGAASRVGGGELSGEELNQALSAIHQPWLPAIAAGGALVALAAAPLAFGREPLRLTIGLTLGLLGLMLAVAGLEGPPTAFASLCLALLLAAIAAGGWALTLAATGAARPVGHAIGLPGGTPELAPAIGVREASAGSSASRLPPSP